MSLESERRILADLRSALSDRSAQLENANLKFGRKWGPCAIFQLDEFQADLRALCKLWSMYGADTMLCEMATEVDPQESGTALSTSTAHARSIPKHPRK